MNNAPSTTAPVPPDSATIGFIPNAHELEKHKILKRIAELREMGYNEEARVQELKYKEILNPTIPFRAQEWLNKFITYDKGMIRVKHNAGLLSKDNINDTVLITGPTGTGKELLARALHGDRLGPKFLAINCAAMPEHLLESELFGHVKGAFTGAVQEKQGMFKEAETIFLDEVGELPILMQAKLLRVLQEKRIRPVGSNEEIQVNRCRVVCATLKDLPSLVEAGKFREDLLYRINTFELKLTPLSERTDDIVPITDAYADEVERKENGNIHGSNKWARGYKIKSTLLTGNVRSIQQIVRRKHVLGEMPEE